MESGHPLQGAAYKVLYERFAPANVGSRAGQQALTAEFAEVTRWAADQAPEVCEAYRWAVTMLTAQVEKQVRSNELQKGVLAAERTIPRPPEKAPRAA